MLKLRYFVFVVTLFILSKQAEAQLITVELRAIGLTCSMCSNAILKQLESIPEIDSIRTDLNSSTFYVSLHAGNKLTPLVFREKVENAGFFVGYFAATTTLENLKLGPFIVVNATNEVNEIQRFQVLDRGYISEKEYKKLQKELREFESYSKNIGDRFHVKVMEV
jgi:copper chaperone CopZ